MNMATSCILFGYKLHFLFIHVSTLNLHDSKMQLVAKQNATCSQIARFWLQVAFFICNQRRALYTIRVTKTKRTAVKLYLRVIGGDGPFLERSNVASVCAYFEVNKVTAYRWFHELGIKTRDHTPIDKYSRTSDEKMQRCYKCKELRALSAFGKDSSRPSGHRAVCRSCRCVGAS